MAFDASSHSAFVSPLVEPVIKLSSGLFIACVINPAFPQFQIDGPKSINTFLPTFKAAKERKMSQAFSNNNNAFNNSFNTNYYITPDDKSEILAWLSPLEPWVRHRDIGAQRVDSIGGWLLETKEFTRWRDGGRENESNHATLFCEGNPGVGKSYIW